ncbi:MAG: hypothetical protein SF053_21795 [Bacteroidia bacterium]|nr:hypothetical protein [Bacteroidia bacterium]
MERANDLERYFITMTGEEILNMISNESAAATEKNKLYKSMSPEQLSAYKELLTEKYSSRENFILLVSYHEATHGAFRVGEGRALRKEIKFFIKNSK